MTADPVSIEQLTAERDAALAHCKLLTTEISRLERQLIAEQDRDELLIRAHERLLQLRPGWPEADHGSEAANRIEHLSAALNDIASMWGCSIECASIRAREGLK